MEITVDQKKAALKMILAVGDTIREVGEIPSGILYSALMAHFPNITLNNYQSIMTTLRGTGLIEEKNNVVRWIGPRGK